MFQGKQTVLDMLRNTVPHAAQDSARKRSCPSLIDGDFEDFAPAPRKFSRPMVLTQNVDHTTTALSNSSKTVIRSSVAGESSSGFRQNDEVHVHALSCLYNYQLAYFNHFFCRIRSPR
jgi:hypothetical protein